MVDQTLRPSDFQHRDFGALLREQKRERPFEDVVQRADAKLAPYVPVTVEDRFKWFAQMGYHPSGLYLPDDEEQRADILRRVRALGGSDDLDERISGYVELQEETGDLELDGVSGRWTGQQAVARSRSRFRLVEYGRRAGKTFHAAREGAAMVRFRPGSHVWCCAPDMGLVDRTFQFIKRLLVDAGQEMVTLRDNDDEKLIILPNRAVVEGISLHNYNRQESKGHSAAGEAVDLAIVDEAAYIGQEAWTIGVLPTLTDRNGQALFLSTPAGIDSYFHKLGTEGENKTAWEVFQEESWVSNFYVFPQGRQTQTLVEAEGEMEPLEFLEQFGAVPQASRRLIYPQYRDRVHTVPNIAYNPSYDVKVGVDPSGGANEYAVLVTQDKGETIDCIDEFYVPGAVAEDIGPILDKRPWRENVTDVVLDSAWPSDIQRWVQMGWPAYAVYEKPRVEERLPLVRRLLRDPLRFYRFYMERVRLVLIEWGMEGTEYSELDTKMQAKLAIAVEEQLSDNHLTPQDVASLKSCSHIRISAQHCPNFIRELKTYRYMPPRVGKSPLERPLKSNDHLCDCFGYLTWQFKRWDDMGSPLATPDVSLRYDRPVDPDEWTDEWQEYDRMRVTPEWRHSMFVQDAREQAHRQSHQVTRGTAGTIRLRSS